MRLGRMAFFRWLDMADGAALRGLRRGCEVAQRRIPSVVRQLFGQRRVRLTRLRDGAVVLVQTRALGAEQHLAQAVEIGHGQTRVSWGWRT